MISLEELNALPRDEAGARFRECCGASRWVERMVKARPFANLDAMLHAADRAWEGMGAADWHEAFAAHPRIGERAGSAWSAGEQHEAGRAKARVRARIAELNREYEERFGHIYIVCATGRSGEEILDDLLARVGNGAEHELGVAAREQHRITRLRLGKLIGVEGE